MKVSEVLKKYPKLLYQATDGKFYRLKDKYPICLRQEGNDEVFYLDTGGPMSGNIDFFQAKIVNGQLLRRGDDSKWPIISPKVIIDDLTQGGPK